MFILQMAGFPGSGKSTLSKIISKETGAIVIDRDIIKSSMLNNNLTNEIASDISYKVTFDLASYYLSLGLSVIIDTPCYYRGIIDKGQELAKQYKADYKFIECKVDDFEIIKNRITARDNMISQVKAPTFKGFERSKERAKRPEEYNYLIIDTSSLNNIEIDKVLTYLDTKEDFQEKIHSSTII